MDIDYVTGRGAKIGDVMNDNRNYEKAVEIIKTAILQSQYDAARSVNEKQIMLTRSSACDPDVVEKLKAWLKKTGGDALITTSRT